MDPRGVSLVLGPKRVVKDVAPLTFSRAAAQPAAPTIDKINVNRHGARLLPRAASRSGAGANSPQRTFSVVQSAMKIPGLASALHLIGVNDASESSSNNNSNNDGSSNPAANVDTINYNDIGAGPEQLSPYSARPLSTPQDIADNTGLAGLATDPITAASASATNATSTAPSILSETPAVALDTAASPFAAPFGTNGNGNGGPNGHTQPSAITATGDNSGGNGVPAQSQSGNGYIAMPSDFGASSSSNGVGSSGSNGSSIGLSGGGASGAADAAAAAAAVAAGGLPYAAVSEPFVGSRVGNNIMPYNNATANPGSPDPGLSPQSAAASARTNPNSGGPFPNPNSGGRGSSSTSSSSSSSSSSSTSNLASDIRGFTSWVHAIVAQRVENMDKIAQQEMALAAKDAALRAREERIGALEVEVGELRRSLGAVQGARLAAEEELQRLRAAAAASLLAAPPTPSAAAATASTSATAAAQQTPPQPQPQPQRAASDAPSSPVAAAAAAPASAPTSSFPPPPTHVTSPPVAVTSSAPAAAATITPPPQHAPAPPPPPPPRVPEILLSYRSSWPAAYLHFNLDGRGWTAPPGVRMEPGGGREHTIRLQGRSLEFVVTNGSGDWDSPAGGGGVGRNYLISGPGEYRLLSGSITLVKVWQPA